MGGILGIFNKVMKWEGEIGETKKMENVADHFGININVGFYNTIIRFSLCQ